MRILQFLRDNVARDRQPVNVVRNAEEATIYIYDAIFPDGWGIGAMDVVNALAAHKDASVLHVKINSPGGDVAEGRAIMSALADFPGKKIAHIDSMCLSAATSVALACNEIEMTDGAFFMIHNASGGTYGDKNAHRDRANLLEKIEGAIVTDYITKTGKTEEELRAYMNAETWFTAAEALELGFVDSIAKAPVARARNMWNLSAFANAPKALTDPPPDPPSENKTEEPAPEAGFFMSAANANRLRLALIA